MGRGVGGKEPLRSSELSSSKICEASDNRAGQGRARGHGGRDWTPPHSKPCSSSHVYAGRQALLVLVLFLEATGGATWGGGREVDFGIFRA